MTSAPGAPTDSDQGVAAPAARGWSSYPAPGTAVVPAGDGRPAELSPHVPRPVSAAPGAADATHVTALPATPPSWDRCPPARPGFEFSRRPSVALKQRPRTVDVAFWSLIAATAVGLVAAALVLVDLPALEASVRSAIDQLSPAETAATRERVVALSGLVVGGTAVGLPLLTGLMALAVRAGRGWARTVVTLLIAATALLALLSITAVPPLVSGLLAVAVGLGVVGVVRASLPAANTWYSVRAG